MADQVFLAGIQLCGGQTFSRGQEMRVVAEAAAATRLRNQDAGPDSFGDQRPRIFRMAHQHHDAVVVAAHRLLQRSRLPDQLAVVVEVHLLARQASRRFAIASRAHAGGAAERRHANARVVGQRRQTRSFAGMPCLRQRIFDEGCMGLLSIVDAEFLLHDDRDAERSEQGLELPGFSRVAGCEDPASCLVPGRFAHVDTAA